jgi:hypothetical protein
MKMNTITAFDDAIKSGREDQAERPDCFTPDEWEAVLKLKPNERKAVLDIRKREAEEAKIAEHWAVIVDDMEKVGSDADEEAAWDAIVGRFCACVEPHDWGEEDEIAEFTFALMRRLGFRPKQVRNHGEVWAPTH